MVATTEKLTIRYMQPQDISEVVDIDYASFNPPWPERSYRFEIHESQVSYMVVLEKVEKREVTGFKRLMSSLRGDPPEYEHVPMIVGYGGLWKIADEAHISTIASHPEHRGKKYGEIVLSSMLKRAIALKAGYVVLEVRVSNEVAQKLYRKYGFQTHDVKKNYYHHDQEDAYDMRVDLTPDNIAHINKLVETLSEKVSFQNRYSNTVHPRLGR